MNTTTTPEAAELARQEAFNATFSRIRKAWGRSLSPKDLTKDYRALNEALEAARAKLDSAWVACRGSLATPAEFTAALDGWEAANYRAVGAVKTLKAVR